MKILLHDMITKHGNPLIVFISTELIKYWLLLSWIIGVLVFYSCDSWQIQIWKKYIHK